MTKFNPEGKEVLTYGECLEPAMEITDPEDAAQYFKDYVAFIEPRDDDMIAESMAKENLGYYAGYYSTDTRERVERLFSCQHPVFGAIAEKGNPTPEEALEMGRKMSAEQKQG